MSVTTPTRRSSPGREQASLLLGRIVVALVWAAALLATGPGLGVATAVVLVLYPVADLVLVVVDALRSRRAGPVSRGAGFGLAFNVVVSAIAAVALAVAASSGVSSVLTVWGVWAVVAGLGQFVVALARRRTRRGQWPLIASGGLSCLVGLGFVVMSAGPAPALTPLAGYAAAGAVFALVGLLRLRAA
ncbi:DUF308 domain-containing protein [Actinomycetospora termitidis]|uniref:DUF308 domain-containing protein n=1 Tax=Actinomycetospora termitidis TaxID=3053470 RepID=A0ABT7MHL6_9PSEU|nr:DUF308 domain-containing protein [Actinomycetospora sp. Odt1-22]MDL5160164.1 DUF308 domain-containing protein [Actinomycetospora sp. Odt1-22]